MQKVRVAEVSVKEGTNEKGPWVNTRVTGDDGAVFGTFSKSAAEIKKGDLIELEPVVKGKNVNFSEWKMLEKAAASSDNGGGSASAPAGYKRDTEAIRLEYNLKAYLQQVDRISIEQQSSLHRLVELVIADKLKLDNPRVKKALTWAESRFDQKAGAAAPSEAVTTKSDKGETPAPSKTPAPAAAEEPIAPSFPHVGALLKWCAEQGVDRKAFMSIVGVKEEELARVDIETVHTLIRDHLREHGQLEKELFPEG